jgi:nitrile hydratase
VSDHDHERHGHEGHDGHDHAHHEAPRSRRARPEFEIRAMALEAALVEVGRTSTDAIDAFVEHLEHRMGPHHGARVVARAWIDPAFKDRLLADGTTAVAELGIAGAEGDNVRVVENTESVHHLVVCTLCSCYPWPLLGVPPVWYKSFAYRSRAVSAPRAVLREFGTELPADVEVRVWDSSAAVRYLVLPQRPAGTESLGEDELAAMVTRDHMVGVRR